MKELFVIGLFVLAIGIATLVFGLTVTHDITVFGVSIPIKQGDPVLTSIGAGLSVLGAGVIIASIVWGRRQD